MAKSAKKTAAKSVKKAAAKAVKRASAKKSGGTAIKKPVKIAAKKKVEIATKKAAKKAIKKSAKKSAGKSAKRAPGSRAKSTGKTFLVIYHAPFDAMNETANVSPEQQAAGMALWEAWAQRCGIKLRDMGAPLMNGKRLAAGNAPTPSTREVAGYSLLTAEDWDDVMSLLEGHPHISGWNPDATIEIHETIEIPGM
ncbi:MAG: hypothetical protein ABI472_06705 [Ginsengibacter sp.]